METPPLKLRVMYPYLSPRENILLYLTHVTSSQVRLLYCVLYHRDRQSTSIPCTWFSTSHQTITRWSQTLCRTVVVWIKLIQMWLIDNWLMDLFSLPQDVRCHIRDLINPLKINNNNTHTINPKKETLSVFLVVSQHYCVWVWVWVWAMSVSMSVCVCTWVCESLTVCVLSFAGL